MTRSVFLVRVLLLSAVTLSTAATAVASDERRRPDADRLLRGLPLRGRRQLVAEAPDVTTVIGSFRIKPGTQHFGWHWSLVQPLLHRHHHQISPDVRLHGYLLEIVTLHLQLLAGRGEPA